MDEQGLWRLFFATGLPEAYLALRGAGETEPLPELPYKAAFQPVEGHQCQI